MLVQQDPSMGEHRCYIALDITKHSTCLCPP